MAGNTNELPMNPKVISRPSPPPQPSLIFPIPVQPLKTYALFHFAGMSNEFSKIPSVSKKWIE